MSSKGDYSALNYLNSPDSCNIFRAQNDLLYQQGFFKTLTVKINGEKFNRSSVIINFFIPHIELDNDQRPVETLLEFFTIIFCH